MESLNFIKDVYKWLLTSGQARVGSKEQLNLVENLILEELAELKEAYQNNNIEEQKDAIVDLLWVVLNWGYYNNLDLDDTIKKVSISNWSKFCSSEEEAIATVNAYKSGTHWAKPNETVDCFYTKLNEHWVVKRTDGKILKSINYKPVTSL